MKTQTEKNDGWCYCQQFGWYVEQQRECPKCGVVEE